MCDVYSTYARGYVLLCDEYGTSNCEDSTGVQVQYLMMRRLLLMCEVYSTSCCEDVMCTVGTRY